MGSFQQTPVAAIIGGSWAPVGRFGFMDKTLQIINTLAAELGWWVYLVVAALVAYVFVKIYIWVDKSSQAILHMKRSPEERDSVRVYTRQEKNEALARCRRRCEGTGIFFRCRTRDGDKGKGLQLSLIHI